MSLNSTTGQRAASGAGHFEPPLLHPVHRIGARTLDFRRQVALMAIINRTPDSFYDAGRTFGQLYQASITHYAYAVILQAIPIAVAHREEACRGGTQQHVGVQCALHQHIGLAPVYQSHSLAGCIHRVFGHVHGHLSGILSAYLFGFVAMFLVGHQREVGYAFIEAAPDDVARVFVVRTGHCYASARVLVVQTRYQLVKCQTHQFVDSSLMIQSGAKFGIFSEYTTLLYSNIYIF